MEHIKDKLKYSHETILICENSISIKPDKKRTLGALKGKIKIEDNFDDDLPPTILSNPALFDIANPY